MIRPLTRAEIRRMKKLWAKVPPITGCKGLCWESCANAPMHPVEARYLGAKYPRQTGGVERLLELPILGPRAETLEPADCPFLVNRRCSIYEDRPLVCRLFGQPLLGHLRCPYGCDTTHKLTAQQGADLMTAMAQAGNEVS
ncbi:MAG TPA: YkgJ family cysteine cluster protein [Rugosimonospora sp.]|nr:YkgJ family cysteine cluster protein [Rugosimonospora sp.]